MRWRNGRSRAFCIHLSLPYAVSKRKAHLHMSPLAPEAVIRLLAAASAGNSPDCCRSIQQSPMSAVAEQPSVEIESWKNPPTGFASCDFTALHGAPNGVWR